jgi:outer membrane protein assembly factor BamE (lipoprotein component of BamABCDE complex)
VSITRHRYVLLITAALIVIAGLAVAAYSPHVRTLGDALGYLMFLREDRTTFAPGFTEAKFDSVKIGMSEAEVLTILGEPLEKDGHSDKRYWRYSKGPPDSSYWFRVLTLQGGFVIDKDAHYDAD